MRLGRRGHPTADPSPQFAKVNFVITSVWDKTGENTGVWAR
jgi:hypothetical protein